MSASRRETSTGRGENAGSMLQTDEADEQASNLGDRGLHAGPDVADVPAPVGLERTHEGPGDVADVHQIHRLLPAPVDEGRLTVEETVQEDRHDGGVVRVRVLAGPVHVEEAQDVPLDTRRPAVDTAGGVRPRACRGSRASGDSAGCPLPSGALRGDRRPRRSTRTRRGARRAPPPTRRRAPSTGCRRRRSRPATPGSG